MLYTVTTHYKKERLYSCTYRVEANSPNEAKEIALRMLLETSPNATEISQRAQRTKRD